MRAIRLAVVVATSSSRLTSPFYATGFSFYSKSAASTSSLLAKYTFHPRFGGHVVASLSASSTTKLNAATAKELAESVLKNPKYPPTWPYTPQDFDRQDESPDDIFYSQPRLVYHIDDYAVEALTKYYTNNFQNGADVLDICSSWVSHYPTTESNWKPGNVLGLGMNEYELSQNKQLSNYVLRDLNENPTFPFDDESFDIVTCVVSVDYLNKPKEIFNEIGRVLRPGGKCYISMSNRCFPTKAFQIWLRTNDLEHIFIVGSFFHYTNKFKPATCDDISPNPGRSDPMYVVWATKK
jgi:hypothetical protein